MATVRQELEALRAQVAEMATELERYHREACIIQSLQDVTGYPMTAASFRATAGQAGAKRPRHLHSVSDSAS